MYLFNKISHINKIVFHVDKMMCALEYTAELNTIKEN